MTEGGVPVITQFVGLRDAHAGNAGELVQLVMAGPFGVSVVGATLKLEPSPIAVPGAAA